MAMKECPNLEKYFIRVYLSQKFEDMPRSKFPMDYENGPEDGSFVAHSLHLKSKENEGSVLETHWWQIKEVGESEVGTLLGLHNKQTGGTYTSFT